MAAYDVYIATNGGAWVVWQPGITETEAGFAGEAGNSYAFYSVAVDNVGHRQPTSAQAGTTLVSERRNYMPIIRR